MYHSQELIENRISFFHFILLQRLPEMFKSDPGAVSPQMWLQTFFFILCFLINQVEELIMICKVNNINIYKVDIKEL